MTAPTPATTGTGRPLTYWCCPACGEWVGLSAAEVRHFNRWRNPLTWGDLPGMTVWGERCVERHEARHGIGAA